VDLLARLIERVDEVLVEELWDDLLLDLVDGEVDVLHGGDALHLVKRVLFDHLWTC
jgi:DNA-binding transcriptional LysR family regulator